MKKIEVTDELLYKYMPLADDAEADALEAEIAGEEYVLSKKFEKRMNRLIWKDKHRWVGDFGKFMLKVAVVCFCILTVGLAVTTPPTQATIASGSSPVIWINCSLDSSPTTYWKSRTSMGKG